MRITFRDARLERHVLRNRYDLLLGAVATLEVLIGDRSLYEEVTFPIVELALALKKWSQVDLPRHLAFSFTSLESDEDGFLWFRPESTGWRIGSMYQEYAEMSIWSDNVVREVVDEFVHEVEQWLSHTVGVELGSLEIDHS
jgi:hypothetical protein